MLAGDFLKTTYRGEYTPVGRLTDADSVIAQSFGYRTNDGRSLPGPVNEALAEAASTYASELGIPVIAQHEIAENIPDRLLERVIEHHRTEGKYLDTYEVLEQQLKILGELALRKSIVIAQAHHVTRVNRQANKLGMDTVVPEGLPRIWDPDSEQWWTRNPRLWTIHESVGYPILKKRGHL